LRLLVTRVWRLQAAQPIIDILFHLILGVTIALLEFAFELLAFASDCCQVIFRELVSLLFDVATELPPVAVDTIRVHVEYLSDTNTTV
jgi:hypothetical protein